MASQALSLEILFPRVTSFPYPRSVQGLETLAKYRGMMSGFSYAEAFQLQRLVFNVFPTFRKNNSSHRSWWPSYPWDDHGA